MINFIRAHFRPALIAITIAIPLAARAAAPEAELLRLTPNDTTFCVVVRDVRGFAANVWDGPFAMAFRKSALGKAFAAAPEYAKIEQFRRQVPKALQIEWSKIRDDVFGDVVVLSYHNGPPGKPEMERGVLLTWARDPKLAATLVDRLNAVQKESGELSELRPINYKGETYFQRVKNKGEHEFYLLKGPIFAFSSQESAIRRVIELESESPSAERQVPPLVKEMERMGGRGFATFWLNPRSFDAELANRIKSTRGQEAAFLTTFGQCWKALDGVAIDCRIGRNLDIDLILATRREGLPAPLLKFATAFDQPSSFWRAVPEDALLAVAGRFDLPALIETISTFVTPEVRQKLFGSAEQGLAPVFGKKTVQMLPAHLGPDFGICVMPPASEKTLLPEFLAAVRIQPSEGNRMEQAIKDALEVGATLLRVNLNSKSDEPVRLETKTQGNVEVRFLSHEKLFPPGVRPAFALKDGHLMLATNPDRILNADVAGPNSHDGPNRLAIISFRRLRDYLKVRRGDIAGALAKHQSIPRNDALAQIDKILSAIELLDRVELLNASKRPGEMKLTLQIQTMEPLVGK